MSVGGLPGRLVIAIRFVLGKVWRGVREQQPVQVPVVPEGLRGVPQLIDVAQTIATSSPWSSHRARRGFLPVARPMTSSPKEWNLEARSADESIPAAANRTATRSCSSIAAALLNASSRMRPGATNPRLTA